MSPHLRTALPAEPQRQVLSIAEFCRAYGIGRTKVYEEIRQGRLRLHKIGKRSIIAVGDAEAWFKNLRVVEPALPTLPPLDQI